MNLYELTFVADTTSAIAEMRKLEAELVSVGQVAFNMNHNLTAANNALTAMTAQMNGTASQVNTLTGSLGGMHGGLINVANAMQLVAMLAGPIGDLGERFNAAREGVRKMTEEAMELRDTLREVANLQGKDGPDDEVAADVLKLGMASGMMPKEATEFMEQFLGSAPAGVTKGNISDKKPVVNGVEGQSVLEEVAEEGAKFGARVGLKAKTAGDFAGVMAQYQKIPDRATGAKVMGQVAYGLNEGRGNMDPLMSTLLGVAGSVVDEGGPMEDLGELATILGVASTHSNPHAAGTRLRQSVRTLRETKGDHGAWLQKQGVTNGMGHLARLKQIKPALMAEVAKGKGLDQAIKEFVTDDDSEARSLAEQLKDIDLMDARLKKMRGITGKEVMEKNNNFFSKEKAGQRRMQKARKAGQEFVVGQANENLEMARENSEQMMRDQGQIGGTGNTTYEAVMDGFGLFPMMGFAKERDRRKSAGALNDVIAQARQKGMSEKEIYDAMGIRGVRSSGDMIPSRLKQSIDGFAAVSSDEQNREKYKRLSEQVQRRGGNVIGSAPDIGAKLDKLVDVNKDILREQKARVQQAAQQARQQAARPVAPPARPGAAAPRR